MWVVLMKAEGGKEVAGEGWLAGVSGERRNGRIEAMNKVKV